jgi:hypothetical protein
MEAPNLNEAHNMDKKAIEGEARRLQYEIWSRRDVRYQLGVPGIPTLFDPRSVADHCGLYFDELDKLDTDYRGGGEAAGLWQRGRFPSLAQFFVVSARAMAIRLEELGLVAPTYLTKSMQCSTLV